MEKFFAEVEFETTVSNFRKRKRMSCVHVSTKRKNRKFHIVVMQRRQRTVQKMRDAHAKLFFGQSKPIAFLPFLLPLPFSLLKFPNIIISIELRLAMPNTIVGQWIKLRYTRGSFQYVANCSLKTNLATPSGQSKTKRRNFNVGVDETLNFVSKLN